MPICRFSYSADLFGSAERGEPFDGIPFKANGGPPKSGPCPPRPGAGGPNGRRDKSSGGILANSSAGRGVPGAGNLANNSAKNN